MKMPFTLDAPQDDLAVLSELEQSRDDMLSEYRAGKRNSVTFSATTYVHGPNRNHTRLNDDELERFAESFKGQPFLSDHSRTLAHRGGTIVDSRLVDLDGKKAIRQTVKAVKPWAVEGVLDGTVDRFSIGWNANEYLCTACDKPFFKCGHDIPDLGEKDKDGKTVEVLMKGIEGTEVSAVTHPAVSGTGVLDALRQLKETVSGASRDGSNQEDEMKEKVLSLLELAADTPDDVALTTLEARLKSPTEKVPASVLTALELKADVATDEVIAAVIRLTAPGNYVPRAEFEKLSDELSDMRADELVRQALKLQKITPAGVEWAREKAKQDPAFMADYIKHAPVQGPPLSGAPPVPQSLSATTDEPASELAHHIYSQMGLTDEEYRAVVAAERAN